MGEVFRFFDSTVDDERRYSADEFAEYFRQLLTNGVFNGGDNLRVTTHGTDMNAKILEGYAWIEGYMYKIDEQPLQLTLDDADVNHDRIDRIVIRLDKTLENRYIKAFVLRGTPDASPAVPAITRNNNIYEISLAQIRVKAGKSYISTEDITDERLNKQVCGLINSLIQADTTNIFNQFQGFLNTKKQEFIGQWQQWFNFVNEDYDDRLDDFMVKTKAFLQSLEDNLTDADVTYLDNRINEVEMSAYNFADDTGIEIEKDGVSISKGNLIKKIDFKNLSNIANITLSKDKVIVDFSPLENRI
jgi:hypothetical protein